MQDVQKITEIQSMKIYLDNCCFARPYNDQTSLPLRLESEATLDIQTTPYTLAGTTNHERIQRNIWFFQIKIKSSDLSLGWLSILDFENNENPYLERRTEIQNGKECLIRLLMNQRSF